MVSIQPTVLILDDDPDVRESLQALLESRGFHVETFDSVGEFLQRATSNKAHCAVVDWRLPGATAVDVLRRARQEQCTIPFVVITGYGDVPTAVRAMQAGVADFFTKPLETRELIARVEELAQEEIQRDSQRLEQREVGQRLQSLTPREREVLERVVQGKPTKKIAEELGISAKTVEVHRSHVTRKMHVRSVAELVRIVTKFELERDPDSKG